MNINNTNTKKTAGGKENTLRYYFTLFVAFCLTLCISPISSHARSETSLRIIYGGNLLGTVKPCG